MHSEAKPRRGETTILLIDAGTSRPMVGERRAAQGGFLVELPPPARRVGVVGAPAKFLMANGRNSSTRKRPLECGSLLPLFQALTKKSGGEPPHSKGALFMRRSPKIVGLASFPTYKDSLDDALFSGDASNADPAHNRDRRRPCNLRASSSTTVDPGSSVRR
jgi:hypothetical protein